MARRAQVLRLPELSILLLSLPRVLNADWAGAAAAAGRRGDAVPVGPAFESAGFSEKMLGSFVDETYGQALGVLLGVGRGARAMELLSTWQQGVLFLVDPYIHLRRGYDREENVKDDEHQRIYEHLRNVLHERPDVQGRYSFVREFSFAVPSIWKEKKWGPQPMFAFLDANPSYGAVRTDLEAWWPLIASGGLLAGSNYTSEGDGSVVGVSMAVHEFAMNRGLRIFVTTDEQEPSWILQKAA